MLVFTIHAGIYDACWCLRCMLVFTMHAAEMNITEENFAIPRLRRSSSMRIERSRFKAMQKRLYMKRTGLPFYIW